MWQVLERVIESDSPDKIMCRGCLRMGYPICQYARGLPQIAILFDQEVPTTKAERMKFNDRQVCPIVIVKL